MRFLSRATQQDVYVRIVEVIKVLVTVKVKSPKDEKKCAYAIYDMYEIARLIGGIEMTKALEVKK